MNMKALITGASSGLGRDMARILSDMGYDLILAARNEAAMEELKKELKTSARIISVDLSSEEACFNLYEQTKDENIDILINNAGFGVFGNFCKTELKTELNLINVNVKALHILTKLFLKDFVERDSGYILNVSSLAGLVPGGPLFAAYYASKSYVRSLTLGIYEELRRKKSKVSVSAFCPGPVNTNFNKRAGVAFTVSSVSSVNAANYAIKKMFKKKLIIIPTAGVRLVVFAKRFFSDKFVMRATYNIQKNRGSID